MGKEVKVAPHRPEIRVFVNQKMMVSRVIVDGREWPVAAAKLLACAGEPTLVTLSLYPSHISLQVSDTSPSADAAAGNLTFAIEP